LLLGKGDDSQLGGVHAQRGRRRRREGHVDDPNPPLTNQEVNGFGIGGSEAEPLRDDFVEDLAWDQGLRMELGEEAELAQATERDEGAGVADGCE